MAVGGCWVGCSLPHGQNRAQNRTRFPEREEGEGLPAKIGRKQREHGNPPPIPQCSNKRSSDGDGGGLMRHLFRGSRRSIAFIMSSGEARLPSPSKRSAKEWQTSPDRDSSRIPLSALTKSNPAVCKVLSRR